MRKNNMVKNGILAIASFLLTASFAFADGKAIPIPLPNDIFIVENDQSVQKTARIVTIEHRPASSIYVVRGQVQYRDVEGAAYLEMWNVMPDGRRSFSRTLAEHGTMRKIQGTSDWREFELPFNLMGHRPESVTLEINVVMPGKGTIELTGLTVSDMKTSASSAVAGELYNQLTGAFIGALGGLCGTFAGCLATLFCLLYMRLVPRGEGRELLTKIVVGGIVIGAICLPVGLGAIILRQPYAIWSIFVVIGVLFLLIPPFILRQMQKDYEQAAVELRKLQALDA
jgi:hypothetical protein